MSDTVNRKRLRDIAAELWPDVRDARRVIADAQIDSPRISWDDPSISRWQSIITEADKQAAVGKLVSILVNEYPNNIPLREACAPWLELAYAPDTGFLAVKASR